MSSSARRRSPARSARAGGSPVRSRGGSPTDAAVIEEGDDQERLFMERVYKGVCRDTGVSGSREGCSIFSAEVALSFKEGTFNMRRKRAGVRACLAIENGLQTSAMYSKVDLYGNAVRGMALTSVMNLMRTNAHLCHLNIGGNGIKLIEDMETVAAEVARPHTHLLTLELGCTTEHQLNANELGDISGMRLAQALAVNVTLTSLCLRQVSLGPRAAMALGDALAPGANCALQRLRLSSNSVMGTHSEKLFTSLASNTSLQALELDDVGLQEGASVCIARALQLNQTLTSLDLTHNEMGEFGCDRLCLALMSNRHTRLATLKLAHNQVGAGGAHSLAQMLSVNRTITKLDVSQNGIQVPGGIALAESLVRNEQCKLEVLVLNGNPLTDKTALRFAASLRTNISLQTLSLDDCKIGERGGVELARALQHNSVLTSLSLQSNFLSETTGKRMVEMLQMNTTLITLDCRKNQVGHSSYGALSKLSQRNAAIAASAEPLRLRKRIAAMSHITQELELLELLVVQKRQALREAENDANRAQAEVAMMTAEIDDQARRMEADIEEQEGETAKAAVELETRQKALANVRASFARQQDVLRMEVADVSREREALTETRGGLEAQVTHASNDTSQASALEQLQQERCQCEESIAKALAQAEEVRAAVGKKEREVAHLAEAKARAERHDAGAGASTAARKKKSDVARARKAKGPLKNQKQAPKR